MVSSTVAPPHEEAAEGASLRRTVVHNTLSILAGRGAATLLSAAGSIILVRYLSTTDLGTYAALYAYVGIFAAIATLGIEPLIVKEGSSGTVSLGTLLRSATHLAGRVAFTVAGVAYFVALVLGYGGRQWVLLALVVTDLLLLAPLRLSLTVFQIELRQWVPSLLGTLRQAVWVVGLGGIVLLSAGVPGIVLLRLGLSVAEVLAVLWLVRHIGLLSEREDRMVSRRLFRSALPLAFGAAAGAIYHRIDQVMLHLLAGNLELASYVVAVNIAELLTLLATATAATLLPLLSRAVSPERFMAVVGTATKYLFGIGALVLVVLGVAAAPFLEFVYGARYRGSGGVLAVLTWAEIGVFSGTIICTALIARGEHRWIPIAGIAGAAVNVLLNYYLIPRYGAQGAAAATFASYAAAGYVVFLAVPAARSVAATVGWNMALPCMVGLTVTGLIYVQATITGWTAALLAGLIYASVIGPLVFASDLALVGLLLRRRRGVAP